MKSYYTICFFILLCFASFGQSQQVSSSYKFSINTTWLSFSNFGKPDTNTHHYELQARYYLSEKDAVGVKLATWKLFAPVGIPLWDDQFLKKDSFYPGRLRESGIGVTYQRRLWKGLFVNLEVLPLFTTYLNEDQTKAGKGFKLYNSYHVGYHVPLFKKGRFFLDPQLHVNHWPINTNVPEEFEAMEANWSNFFFIEPNLILGYKF